MGKQNFKLKKYSLCFKLSGKRKEILSTIFGYFDLDGMKEHIEYWKYAGLVNEICIYETGKERRFLIEFCADFEKIIEVFYILSNHKEKQLKLIPAEQKKSWKKYNRCTILTKEEKHNPDSVLKAFAKKYKRLYALAQIVDMLEAVVTLKKADGRYRHSAVPCFLCLNALLELTYP